jgi:hypothetical protein
MTLPVYPRWAGSPWYAPPAIAAVLAVALFILLPASGPIVYLAWKPTVDAPTRQRLERDLHLLAPTHTFGTRWGYIVGDTSERNVRKLLALPEVEASSGLIADPPRAAGRSIIRLAGPFAVQSFIGLLAGSLLLIGARAPSTRTRQAYLIVRPPCCLSAGGSPPYRTWRVTRWATGWATTTPTRRAVRIFKTTSATTV